MQLELIPTATTTVTKHKQTLFRAVLNFWWFFTRCFPLLLISGPHGSAFKWHKICKWEHWLFVLHLASFSSLNLYSYRRGPYICEFRAKCIIKKLNMRIFHQKKWMNTSGYLGILQWILCFVESHVYRALNPKGTTLPLTPYSSVSFLSSLCTEVFYVIKTSSAKRHLSWFWVTRGGVHCVKDSSSV